MALGVKVAGTPLDSSAASYAYACSTAPGDSAVMTPELELLSCYEPVEPFKIGKLTKLSGNGYSEEIDMAKLANLRARNGMSFKKCIGCSVKCGAGCSMESYRHYGDLMHAGISDEACKAEQDFIARFMIHIFNRN